MPMAQHIAPRVLYYPTRALCVIVAMVVLLTASAARTENANGPNRGNVLAATSTTSSYFARWMTPAAPAAQRTIQRPQRIHQAKTKPRTPIPPRAPVARTEPAAPLSAPPAWPSAATTVGGAALIPVTIKTVREMLASEPAPQIVFENELSDIDLAAHPTPPETIASSEPAATDGSGSIERDLSDYAAVFAMGDTMKSVIQSAWTELLLLMLAGAFAALSAVRLFA